MRQEVWDDKGPEEDHIKVFDWATRLNGETIQASDWEVLEGSVTLSGKDFDDTTATVMVSGGVDGETCLVRNFIETATRPTLDWVGRIAIRAT